LPFGVCLLVFAFWCLPFGKATWHNFSKGVGQYKVLKVLSEVPQIECNFVDFLAAFHESKKVKKFSL
jgi:hypothetical protein